MRKMMNIRQQGFSLICLLVWFIIILSAAVAVTDYDNTNNNEAVAVVDVDDDVDSEGLTEEEENVLLQEIIKEGRGEREQQGIRDQWESKEHLHNDDISTYKSARQHKQEQELSQRVINLLHQYHLKCVDCSESEAIIKINQFVKETKEEIARQQQQQQRQSNPKATTALFGTIFALMLGSGLFYLYQQQQQQRQGGGNLLGNLLFGGRNTTSRRENDHQTKRLQKEIQSQRQRVEEQMIQKALLEKRAKRNINNNNPPPSWQDQEANEIWTSKQSKQFNKALLAFGGVPPKARYGLIADKVEGKTRNECLLHHKYLEWLKIKTTTTTEKKRKQQHQMK